MTKKIIKKVICIGANCIAADIMYSVGLQVPSPMDNISGFNIWKSHFLFDGGIKKLLFKYPHEIIASTEQEQRRYHYLEKIYKFKKAFYIVHNDFDDKEFQKSIKRRIRNFKEYYKQSKKDDTLWYIYSLDLDDENLTRGHFTEILPSLPECCRERLICIGMRGKNPLFREFFKYYIEFDSETDYKWHDKEQAHEILSLLEEKYGLCFQTDSGGTNL